MEDMSVKKAHEVMQAACGIENGDRVKYLRLYKEYEMGGRNTIGDQRDMKIGNVYIAQPYEKNSIRLWEEKIGGKCAGFAPFFCLELVEKAKPKLPPIMVGGNEVKFVREGIPHIEVCGVSVHKATLKEILNRFEEQD